MKNIRVCDRTLCRAGNNFSFREKLEIAKCLDKIGADVIELPEISDVKADTLLVKTILSFVKNSTVSVAACGDNESIDLAAAALSQYDNTLLRIELPVSAIGMEYSCHKKPGKMLELIEKAVGYAVSKGFKTEFCALDATRAEKDFLIQAINTAAKAGAFGVCICDNAANMLPDDFAKFINEVSASVSVLIGVLCDNKNSVAVAQAILAVKSGADFVKTAVGREFVSLEDFADLVRNCGNNCGISCGVVYTKLNRTIGRIMHICEPSKAAEGKAVLSVNEGEEISLDVNDSMQTVAECAVKLGYDLSADDKEKVYSEFLRVASKKKVGSKEIEAIIANVALQVPETYSIETYAINTGNTVSSSAQIVLKKGDAVLQGIGIGDGPIDAAFLTLEKMLGTHFELDDFQIQAVTEGKEAMGRAVVKLRSGGKLYSGSGISTDILGASIRAYISAVNKIVYEEAQ